MSVSLPTVMAVEGCALTALAEVVPDVAVVPLDGKDVKPSVDIICIRVWLCERSEFRARVCASPHLCWYRGLLCG